MRLYFESKKSYSIKEHYVDDEFLSGDKVRYFNDYYEAKKYAEDLGLKEIQSQELTLEQMNESRFSDKELKDIYYACNDRSDNPRYARLAKSVKEVIDGKKKSFRITDRNDLDLLTYALFPDADYDDPELIAFNKKFRLNKEVDK